VLDTQESEEKLLAELFLNLKGAKKKRLNWITIAEKSAEIVKEYGSASKAATKLGVSPALLRAIVSLKNLPQEVQDMVRRGDILFDASQRLNSIKSKDKQIEVARLIVGITSHKQREIIQHAKRFPDSDLVDYRNRVAGQTVRKEKLRVLIIPLREELYQSLNKASKQKGRPIERILPEIIEEWLRQQGARA
jgi:hypothetical protein